ncbi:hypothetical protein MKX03_017721, partial [Papaver bracteatum]
MAFGAPRSTSAVEMEKAKHKTLDAKVPPLVVTTKGNTDVDSSTILDGKHLPTVIEKASGKGGLKLKKSTATIGQMG